jgi:hypothetical protein
LVFDSVPGFGTISTGMNVLTASIPNPVIRFFAKIAVFFALSFLKIFKPGGDSFLEDYKEGLMSPSVLPWMDKTTPRLYMCSKADQAVPFEEIQAHFLESEARGLNVRQEIFEDSPHVAHARAYPTRYWDAVKSLWDSAVSPALR